MAAARADQAARRVGGDPTVVLAIVPLAVLGTEDPLASLHVADRESPNRPPECSHVEAATLAGGEQLEVMQLGQGERFNSHWAVGYGAELEGMVRRHRPGL